MEPFIILRTTQSETNLRPGSVNLAQQNKWLIDQPLARRTVCSPLKRLFSAVKDTQPRLAKTQFKWLMTPNVA
jgi:hypothetical protein